MANNGLSSAEASKLLEQYGRNEIIEKKQSAILKFFSYLWGPIPWMIEVAIILSAIVKDWTDFIIISALLFTNALVGFIEEHQADSAIDALKKNLALKAKVKRDGDWKSVDAAELVPGDLIRLKIGDIIPADCVLLNTDGLKIDQSALTGESLPADKIEKDVVYSGSIVKQGESEGEVKATGLKTYFGKTASLIEEAHTVSHFQKAVIKIGNYLIIIALIMVALILIRALFRGDPFLEILKFSLVLTIAAIPVAMPTVLSVTMAVGSKLLSAKNAVVRKLSAIEELAGINILVSDKTGTLTQNKLSLGESYLNSGTSNDDLIIYAALASKIEDEDPIDVTIYNGIKDKNVLKNYHVDKFIPFDPVIKRAEAQVTDSKGNKFSVTKGAPQIILSLANNKSEIEQNVNNKINEFAHRGFRSLGVAKTNEKNEWQFVGIISLFDPPREDSKSTIESAQKLGVNIKMATGDQQAIAIETSKALGLGQNIIDAKLFSDANPVNQSLLEDEIVKADGFSEVFPEHKYHIVDILESKNNFVGMTGDGVNDAPALKKANCGIAVSGATDAAKAAADIVLFSPGLSTIIDALKESRKIFQRMNNYVIYRIAETIRVLFFMTISIIVFNFYPVTAVMIVLLALLNDGAILSIAYDNVKGSSTPEKWNMPLVFTVALSLGTMGVIESFLLFYLGDRVFNLPADYLQTMIYLKLSLAGHLTVFVARTKGFFWTIKPAKILFFAVVITQIIATTIAAEGIFMSAIGWKTAGLIWAYCFFWFFVEDLINVGVYKMYEERNTNSNWRKLIFLKSN